MKKYLVIIFLLIFSKITVPQIEMDKSLLEWGIRDISWDDFKGIPEKGLLTKSEFSYMVGFKPYKRKIGDTEVTWIESFCYMDRNSSWVRNSYADSVLLLYNQTIFDLVELYTRRLQTEINQIDGSNLEISNKCNTLLTDYLSRIKGILSNLRYETDEGTKKSVVEYWHSKTKFELNQEEKSILPEFKLSHFGLGLTLDIGYGLLTGNSTEYFSNNFNLAFGFDVAYSPITLYLRAILGFNSLLKEFEFNNKTWPKEVKTGIAIPEITLGYPVYKAKDICLTPFLGIGAVEFSVREKDEQFKDNTIIDVTPVFGLNFDYMFSRSLNLFEYFIFREKTNWVIRSRFSASQFNMLGKFQGWTINLTVGVGVFSNIVEL